MLALVGKRINSSDEINEKDFREPTLGTEEHLTPFMPSSKDYANLSQSEKDFSANHRKTAKNIDEVPYEPRANWRPSDPKRLRADPQSEPQLTPKSRTVTPNSIGLIFPIGRYGMSVIRLFWRSGIAKIAKTALSVHTAFDQRAVVAKPNGGRGQNSRLDHRCTRLVLQSCSFPDWSLLHVDDTAVLGSGISKGA